MSDYKVTFGYGDQVPVTVATTAPTVGLAIITAKGELPRPDTVRVAVLHKQSGHKDTWLECHVDQGIIALLP
jgi:hypothetical protein